MNKLISSWLPCVLLLVAACGGGGDERPAGSGRPDRRSAGHREPVEHTA